MKRPVHYYGLSSLVAAFVLAFFVNAQALTLGHLKVLSFLGQPLVAEIEVPEISSDESNSLRVAIASSDAFKSAGLDYSPSVAQITIAGKRRADGRAILEIRSAQAIDAPFLDLVLEITWNTGRMLRDYTVLLDPPAISGQAPSIPSPTLPMQSSSAQVMPVVPIQQRAVVDPSSGLTVKTQVAPSEPKRITPISKLRLNEKNKDSLRTKKGDTAAALANANKPAGVSLDQMLVAMLHSNPQAFTEANVNRLKAGVILDLPLEADIHAVSPTEARKSIQVQAHDFNDFRRKLSANVAANIADEPRRNASGKVTTKVEDHEPLSRRDDRLTLAKPNQKDKTSLVEDKIAKERATSDAAARSVELKKNISELSQIAAAPAAGVASEATSPKTVVTVPVITAPPAVASTPRVVPPPPPRPPVETSFLDQLLTNPLGLPVAAGVAFVGLLLGAFLYLRRRRTKNFEDTKYSTMNFSATRQASDTVFGPIGASHIDTQEASASSTMVYSPSQLATVTGDVDPIAEADVYLAYNRDVQAEEILKEAKRNQPNRSDIQVKLLELYVKRRDTEAFDAGAEELHQLTDGAGDDWSKVRQLARDIGSSHPLFNVIASAFAVSDFPTSQSAYSNTSLSFVPTATQTASAPASSPPTRPLVDQATSGLIDFDLSSLSLDLPPQPSNTPSASLMPTEDPKLALAEEYLSIGDKAGARALIEEVISQHAHTNPQIMAQAQQMLVRLG